jgi:phosphocarrier protein HPr
VSVSRTTTVTLESGLHARPAAEFVKLAKGFASDLSLAVAERTGNCKSLISLLKLGASYGSTVVVTADGPDEAEALDALVAALTTSSPS